MLVISIRPKWADLIRSGEKTVELRKYFPLNLRGSTAYVYESQTSQAIKMSIEIEDIYHMDINRLWDRHGLASCVSRDEYMSYFEGHTQGLGLKLKNCKQLREAWPLPILRQKISFSPPQSWCYAKDSLIGLIGSQQ